MKTVKTMKTMLALAGAALILQGSGAVAIENQADFPVLCSRAYAADLSWLDDINDSSSDDTLAYGIYIGKPLQEAIDTFQGQGWKRADQEGKVIFTRNREGYVQMVALHPHAGNHSLVGSYRIRFLVKDKTQAENMYMQAEKNFSYNFGRPTFTKGSDNRTWVLNEAFAIVVEFNEYSTKLAAAKNHPYEVVIKRELGDYRQLLVPEQ